MRSTVVVLPPHNGWGNRSCALKFNQRRLPPLPKIVVRREKAELLVRVKARLDMSCFPLKCDANSLGDLGLKAIGATAGFARWMAISELLRSKINLCQMC